MKAPVDNRFYPPVSVTPINTALHVSPDPDSRVDSAALDWLEEIADDTDQDDLYDFIRATT